MIVILAILQETNIITEKIVFPISFAVLIGSIVPIYWFRKAHYEEEKLRCEKHIPQKPKSIYFTIESWFAFNEYNGKAKELPIVGKAKIFK